VYCYANGQTGLPRESPAACRRPYKVPRNPRTAAQFRTRAPFGLSSARWHALTDLQRTAWKFSADTPADGYNLFVEINTNLAFLGLDPVDVPPADPRFSDNPVGDLAITNTGGVIALKLPVSAAPAQYTLVYGTAPCSPGMSFPPRFYFLGLLPAPVAGISDITALYVARFGVPPVKQRVFIQTVQQVNGWKDLPKRTTFIVSATLTPLGRASVPASLGPSPVPATSPRDTAASNPNSQRPLRQLKVAQSSGTASPI